SGGGLHESLAVDRDRARGGARAPARRRPAPAGAGRSRRARGRRDDHRGDAAARRRGHQPPGVRRPRARAGPRVVHRRGRVPALPRAGAVTLRELAVWALIAAGGALELLACAGVALMRDGLDKLHYTGPAATGGACLAGAVLV